jgi:hypothetical protein
MTCRNKSLLALFMVSVISKIDINLTKVGHGVTISVTFYRMNVFAALLLKAAL